MGGAVFDIGSVVLAKGGHATREEGMCVMELVAYIAGKPHSDHPPCVSPVLGAFLRKWNDDLDDQSRQRLKDYAPRVINTADDGKDELRGWILTDWMVRTYTPAWLDLAGITEPAAALRALPPLRSVTDWKAAEPVIEDGRQKSAAARDAAWAAARAAATAAAWAAARDAARAAARDAARAAATAAAWAAARAAAWDAARDAAWAAARAAAWDAARDAASYDAAYGAARAKLEPTVTSLQQSAHELIERLIVAEE